MHWMANLSLQQFIVPGGEVNEECEWVSPASISSTLKLAKNEEKQHFTTMVKCWKTYNLHILQMQKTQKIRHFLLRAPPGPDGEN